MVELSEKKKYVMSVSGDKKNGNESIYTPEIEIRNDEIK